MQENVYFEEIIVPGGGGGVRMVLLIGRQRILKF